MAVMIQNNFVGGEISPSLHGRSDLKMYYKSAAKVENFVVAKEGSLRKRRGIGTVGEISGFASSPRLFAYRYDRDEGGLIVIGNSRNTCVVQLRRKDSLDVVAASAALHTVAISDPQLASIRATQIGDTFFVTCKGVFNKKVIVDWNAGTLSVSSYRQSDKPDFPAYAYADGYNSDNTRRFVNSGYRVVYYAAYIIRDGVMSDRCEAMSQISASGSYSINGIRWDKSWVAGAYIDVRIKVPETGFDYILLAKKVGGNYGEVARWYPEDVEDPAEGEDRIVTFHDENIAAGSAVYAQTYTLGDDFSPPLVTSAFQQRLVFANAGSNQMTLWFSEIGNLYNFYADRPAGAEEPFSPTMHATGPAFIRWIVTYQRALIVFTDCGVYSIAGSNTEGFSAATCQISKLSETACSLTIQPIETDSGIIFVGADDKTLYTMAYDIQTDSTLPINQMQLVEHMVRGAKIRAVALQQFPFQIVWCVLSDGTALSFTYEKQQEVAAWTRHRISVSGASLTDAVGLGTVTDSADMADGRTYSDIVFRLAKDGTEYLATFRDWRFADRVGEEEAPVVATLTTLRAESQERTLAGIRKNVKDVLVRLNESGPLKVVATGSELGPQTLAKDETNFAGEAKAMPGGYVNEDGQMTFTSDTADNCEITGVVYKLEVNG